MIPVRDSSKRANSAEGIVKTNNFLLCWLATCGLVAETASETKSAGADSVRAEAPVIRSARSGPWSAPATWDGGKVPGATAKVHVRAGHKVVYDVKSAAAIRSLHIAGTLTFAAD